METDILEKIRLEKDIRVLYVTAPSFPEGIAEAFDQLYAIPSSPTRDIFGLSRPENDGEIVYRAAREMEEGEAARHDYDTLLIPKGNYLSRTVNDFKHAPWAIAQAFEELLAQPGLDPDGYCVEWYDMDRPSVKCLIRLEDNPS